MAASRDRMILESLVGKYGKKAVLNELSSGLLNKAAHLQKMRMQDPEYVENIKPSRYSQISSRADRFKETANSRAYAERGEKLRNAVDKYKAEYTDIYKSIVDYIMANSRDNRLGGNHSIIFDKPVECDFVTYGFGDLDENVDSARVEVSKIKYNKKKDCLDIIGKGYPLTSRRGFHYCAGKFETHFYGNWEKEKRSYFPFDDLELRWKGNDDYEHERTWTRGMKTNIPSLKTILNELENQ